MIPRILHQVWIGDQSKRPTKFLDTWREKHPDWEYILWTEEECARRGVRFECQRQMDEISEINGRADILRWEILYQFGGVAMDADSICLEPLDADLFLNRNGWAVFENENVRKGLIACGAMGFPPKHPLLREIIDHIKGLNLHPSVCNLRAWVTVAVVLLTKKLESGKYRDFSVFPSHMFIPHHFTGMKYQGHKKIYAYQEWSSTKRNYDTINSIEVPAEFRAPARWVSIIMGSFNTHGDYLRECFNSIKGQIGHFGIELVVVNDGSALEYTAALRAALDDFERGTRFTRTKYIEHGENRGIGAAHAAAAAEATGDLVFVMDSDDIMRPDRLLKQITFMDATPEAAVCGAQIEMFYSDGRRPTTKTNHRFVYSWDAFKSAPSPWFMNHPTLCWRRAALEEIGSYDPSLRVMEDFDAEIRALKKFDKIYNLPDVLVQYRLHDTQLTHRFNEKAENNVLRQKILARYL